MSKSECAAASDPLAWHWARKGAGELEKIEATLNLARQLLASGDRREKTRSTLLPTRGKPRRRLPKLNAASFLGL